MFTRDAMFGKKEDQPRKALRENKQPVNLTPGLSVSDNHNSSDPAHADKHPDESPATASGHKDATGSRLIVGPDIKLKGAEITDCDTLVVEGRVEAAMDSRVMQIAEHGVFAGTAGIDIAEIYGRFEGELTARKQLIVYASGKVSGKIRYGRISIEEGGEVSGDVSALTAKTTTGESAGASEKTGAAADIMTAYDPFARKAKTGAA